MTSASVLVALATIGGGAYSPSHGTQVELIWGGLISVIVGDNVRVNAPETGASWLNLAQTCALTTKAVEYAALQALREVRCAYEFREACGVRRIPPLFIRRAAPFFAASRVPSIYMEGSPPGFGSGSTSVRCLDFEPDEALRRLIHGNRITKNRG